MTPTQWVEHVVEQCPGCGSQLSGGWTHRTREVIDRPQVPVQVAGHVYVARSCPLCRRRCIPPTQPDGAVLGQQRLGVNLLSLIAALREEARLPWRTIQWYLAPCTGCTLAWGPWWMPHAKWLAKGRPNWRAYWTHPRQSSGPRRRDRLAGGGTQRLRVDLQRSHPTDISLVSSMPPSQCLRKTASIKWREERLSGVSRVLGDICRASIPCSDRVPGLGPQ